MELGDYLPVLIQILLAVGIGVGILAVSHIFGQKARHGKIKDSPYECGLAAEVSGKTSYSVKFYVTAMLFILFDVDVVFLIPWTLTHRELTAAGIPILGGWTRDGPYRGASGYDGRRQAAAPPARVGGGRIRYYSSTKKPKTIFS